MSLEKSSTQNWAEFYRSSNKGQTCLIYAFQKKYLNNFQQVIIAEISEKINEILLEQKVVNILSAGSGIDFIAYHLKKKFQQQIELTIFDVSSECILLNKKLFNEKFNYIVGDIFNYNFCDRKYDIIYNTGLLEHFLESEQKKIINKIQHLLKKPGYYITLNPHSGGKIYNKYMNIAKQKGIWEFGEEMPVKSLIMFAKDGFELVEERPCCSISQLSFLRYKYKNLIYVFEPLNYFIYIRILDEFVGNLIGYYGIISIFKKFS